MNLDQAYQLRDLKRDQYNTLKNELREKRKSGKITEEEYFSQLNEMKEEQRKTMDEVFDFIRKCKDEIQEQKTQK